MLAALCVLFYAEATTIYLILGDIHYGLEYFRWLYRVLAWGNGVPEVGSWVDVSPELLAGIWDFSESMQSLQYRILVVITAGG